jgi:hypothetical protein
MHNRGARIPGPVADTCYSSTEPTIGYPRPKRLKLPRHRDHLTYPLRDRTALAGAKHGRGPSDGDHLGRFAAGLVVRGPSSVSGAILEPVTDNRVPDLHKQAPSGDPQRLPTPAAGTLSPAGR